MKIVICGAGIVGSAIARHLAAEQNDVTVIDSDPDKIQRITEVADVGAVTGVASHPDMLEQAGMADAELLIAAPNLMKLTWWPPGRAYHFQHAHQMYGSDHGPILTPG